LLVQSLQLSSFQSFGIDLHDALRERASHFWLQSIDTN
jgi:hypothetical protein